MHNHEYLDMKKELALRPQKENNNENKIKTFLVKR